MLASVLEPWGSPGSEEFSGEIAQDLAVVKGAVVLIDAQKGIEVGSERVWDELRLRHTPTIIFVNKADKENVKLDKIIVNYIYLYDKEDAYIDMAYKELEDRYQNYDNINGVKYKIKQNYDNIVVNLEIEVNDDTKSVNFYLPFSLNDDINSITQKISNCK